MTALSLMLSLPTMSWLNICLMSSTAIAPSQSCLFARTSVGTPSTRWSVTIVSAAEGGQYGYQCELEGRGTHQRHSSTPLSAPCLSNLSRKRRRGILRNIWARWNGCLVVLRVGKGQKGTGEEEEGRDAPPRSQNCRTDEERVMRPTVMGRSERELGRR
jgi:hypothetical protein